jgi:hypothetical protein
VLALDLMLMTRNMHEPLSQYQLVSADSITTSHQCSKLLALTAFRQHSCGCVPWLYLIRQN